MYADDLVLLAENEKLQKLLDCVTNWCTKWGLIVNMGKSNVIHFRRQKQPQSKYKFILSGQPLEYVKSYKYLGLEITCHLNYMSGIELLSDSASRALGMLRSRYKSLKYMGFATYNTIYESTVIPVMDYASEIWGVTECPEGEIVQNQAAMSFLGVHRFAPVDGMQGDLGWISSKTRRKVNVLRYWNRLVKMSGNRLTKHIFLWDHNINNKNWCANVREILNEFSFQNDVFECKNIINVDTLSKNAREYDANCWKIRCIGKPKLRTYTKFKESLNTEKYVKCNLSRKERSFLAQIRLCEFSSNQTIDDEEHFLFKCELNR